MDLPRQLNPLQYRATAARSLLAIPTDWCMCGAPGPARCPCLAPVLMLEQVVQTFEGHYQSVLCVAFANDERTIVSASRDGTVRRWSLETGAVLQTHEGHSSRVNSARFMASGTKVVSISFDMTLRIWRTDTGQV